MKKLENKVAIVTGAGAGMGKAIASLFASEGCKVVAADINEDRLEALKAAIAASGGEVTPLLANMAVEADIENMIQTALTEYGRLDILVNNAGIMDHFAPVGELDNEMWDKVMKINVEGPFKAMRSAVRIFLAQGSGVILNIASVGGLQGARAGAAYTTSKHALIGLTKNTGFMYSKSGIRCNAIAPGAVNTSISDTIDFSKITPLVNDRIMAGMPLNPRTGEPDEIARAALFLVSEDASFVNGQTLTVDGGWTAY
ncbi:MAG: SDR family oxidoreductase [Saprospiraceae bacterium]|jgi:NAD(P)-dependent dehydrogenase (short-subunit alcohol dehydrogenase family)|nr:SDR family oxidoreductase [Saprospiraceae bacterium]MDP4821234.1 SDR family oxidoreductase [Saprospiraceae bacterium]MDP4998834.1 SDR family oxidoreductase [Saprospiraceae bacterium]